MSSPIESVADGAEYGTRRIALPERGVTYVFGPDTLNSGAPGRIRTHNPFGS